MTARVMALLIVASSLFAGCSSVPETVFGVVPGHEVPAASGLLLLLVHDAESDGSDPVDFSGDALQAILRSNFVGRGWEVFSAETASRVAGAERARQLELEYFIEGKFFSWHEAALEFQGEPDHAEVELRLCRSSDGVLVAYARGERRGGTLLDIDRPTSRLLSALVDELLEGMLDGEVLKSVPADA